MVNVVWQPQPPDLILVALLTVACLMLMLHLWTRER